MAEATAQDRAVEILWRAVLRHGTWSPSSRRDDVRPDVDHMLACGLDLRDDMQDPGWGIEHEYGSGYVSPCAVSGPSFHECLVCRCGQQFGVWEWSPSPAELVTAVLAEVRSANPTICNPT